MLAKFSGKNLKGPYVSIEKEKDTFCVVLTYSIKQASEIRKFHVAVVQQQLRNVQKKHDARAKLFFCQSKCIVFLLFTVAVSKTPYCCHPEILLPW